MTKQQFKILHKTLRKKYTNVGVCKYYRHYQICKSQFYYDSELMELFRNCNNECEVSIFFKPHGQTVLDGYVIEVQHYKTISPDLIFDADNNVMSVSKYSDLRLGEINEYVKYYKLCVSLQELRKVKLNKLKIRKNEKY